METGYSRREFIKQNSLAGIGAIALGSLSSCGGKGASSIEKHDSQHSIAGMDLERIRDEYKTALFDRFVPNMEKMVIDHQLGGFMCDINIVTGEQESTNKQTWFQGRGIWVYSFLYNHFGKDPRFLEVARKAKDFIVPRLPADDKFFPAMFLQDGTPKAAREGNIYGNLFLAEGLAEYALASGEQQWLDLAKKILFKAVERYDRLDYSYAYKADQTAEGPRIFGHWMILISLATQMLKHSPDEALKVLADRCVEAMTVHHLNSEYNLVNEAVAHDFTPLNDKVASQCADMGHGCEGFAFLMNYAVLQKDAGLFREAVELFKRHVAVAKDEVYGGYFHLLEHTDNYIWSIGKRRWVHEEILLGTMSIIEHTGDPWAIECFLKTNQYLQEKFWKPSYAFVIDNGDRKVDEHSKKRAENYHHPRQLMVCLMAIDRLIERGYRTSGWLDA